MISKSLYKIDQIVLCRCHSLLDIEASLTRPILRHTIALDQLTVGQLKRIGTQD
jgi:hypothetical protein